jgi:hypothetical protein
MVPAGKAGVRTGVCLGVTQLEEQGMGASGIVSDILGPMLELLDLHMWSEGWRWYVSVIGWM